MFLSEGDLISKKDLMKQAFSVYYPLEGENYIKVIRLEDVEKAPIIPQKPKGKWIHWTDDYKDYCTCSKCGYGEEGELLLKNTTPFCPYCGSYNGGKEDEISD